ncbi:odorant receptor 24a-like [Diachasmimorpha longicaudata]|uniref:odorant receptor 24a-like n=1 Tax=Diachasmimorpha longicaudata TaxID=58733 RepID=UPI0030B8969A
MGHIIQSEMEDWSNVSDSRSHRIMTQYAFWGRLAYTVQITAALLITIQTTISQPPTFTTEIIGNNSSSPRNIMMGPSCWIPDTTPISLYLLHYFLIFLSFPTAAIIYPGSDAFMFSTALHLCGQFEILTQSLESVTDNDSYLNQKRCIKKYSKRHNELLMLGKELNELFSLIIFSELFCNGVLICLSGIALFARIKSGKVDNDDINYGLRIYIWYCELFMYSFVGEKLASHAENLHRTIYTCPWYNMSVDIAKDVKFIMMRNNFFCYLTAGGVFVMNHEAFKKISKIMFSCFSVLKLVLD